MIVKDKNRLKKPCEPCESIEEGDEIAVKLFKSLKEEGGIGLAANQIGINKRVCVINVKEPIAFINPKITKSEGEVVVPEQCLSFPKKVVRTKRNKYVTIDSDNHGTVVLGGDTYDDNLLESVCAQHEIDHLDGITMFDRKFVIPPAKSNKIGRNEKVDIIKGGKVRTLKFKKAQPLLEDGWEIVNR